MKNRQYFNEPNKGVEWLTLWLDENKKYYLSYRLRAVLVVFDNTYKLVSCVIEAIPKHTTTEIQKHESRKYKNAILVEKWVSIDEIIELYNSAIDGVFEIDGICLKESTESCSINATQHPFENPYKTYACRLFSCSFGSGNYSSDGPLVSYNHPYYSSINEAVYDWMQFKERGDYSDMKGAILFVLPELRAFVKTMKYRAGQLHLEIGGTNQEELGLNIVGSLWLVNKISHFNEHVINKKVSIKIPDDIENLDYMLIDSDDVIYDGARNIRKGDILFDDANQSRLNIALQHGEGVQIEFKPFIDIKNNKIEEVLKTVIAFANKKGGNIYLGVNDQCQVTGINKELINWAKSNKTNAADNIQSYMDLMKKKIRDKVNGDFDLDISKINYKSHVLVHISIGVRKEKTHPCYLNHKNTIFVRRGANSVKADPEIDMPSLFSDTSDKWKQY